MHLLFCLQTAAPLPHRRSIWTPRPGRNPAASSAVQARAAPRIPKGQCHQGTNTTAQSGSAASQGHYHWGAERRHPSTTGDAEPSPRSGQSFSRDSLLWQWWELCQGDWVVPEKNAFFLPSSNNNWEKPCVFYHRGSTWKDLQNELIYQIIDHCQGTYHKSYFWLHSGAGR